MLFGIPILWCRNDIYWKWVLIMTETDVNFTMGKVREFDIGGHGDKNMEIIITDLDDTTHHSIIVRDITAALIPRGADSFHLIDGHLTFRGFCLNVVIKTVRNPPRGNFLVVGISEEQYGIS